MGRGRFFVFAAYFMMGYCFINFFASPIIHKFVAADEQEARRREDENNRIRQNRPAEIKLNIAGPQQTVVTKMMKNLDNYQYNEANEKAR